MSVSEPPSPPRATRPVAPKRAPETARRPPVKDFKPASRPLNAPRKQVLDPLSRPFLVCLCVGSALAMAGQAFGLDSLAVLAPVVATAAYPAWGIYRRYHERASLRERFADNAYYLGFTFTQIALVIGFAFPLFYGKTVQSGDVLRMFGVALGASMIGLLARTLLVQTGHTVDENADIVEREVETLAQEVEALALGVSSRTRLMLGDLDALTMQLGASRENIGLELATLSRSIGASRADLVSEIEGWTGQIVQTLGQYDARLAQHGRQIDDAGKDVTNASVRARTSIDAEHAGLVDRIGQAARAIDGLQAELHTQVSVASRGISTLADTFVAGAADVNRLQAGMRDRMAEAAETVHAASASLSAGLKALEGMSHATELVASLDERVVKITTDIDRFQGHVQTAAAAAQRGGEQAATAAQGVAVAAQAEIQARADAFSQELDASAKLFEQTLAQFRQELERLRV